jgi:hypothetical protein
VREFTDVYENSPMWGVCTRAGRCAHTKRALSVRTLHQTVLALVHKLVFALAKTAVLSLG